MATTAVDPITQEILASGFHHIAEEMAVVEYRSSYSPIIREMLDFNCGLFTADGRMVANSEQIPAQLGLMQFALESVLEKWGDDVAEGDAFLTNHPYMGGTHTPDLQVFTPLFRRRRASIAWAGSIAHHIDIGGRFPGTESAQCTELFQEGLIFPAVKLVEARHPRPRALRPGRRQRARPGVDARRSRRPAGGLPPRHDAVSASSATATASTWCTMAMETLLRTTAARAEAAFRDWPGPHRGGRGHSWTTSGFEDTPPMRVHAAVHVDDGDARASTSPGSHAAGRVGDERADREHARRRPSSRCARFLGPEVPQNAGLTQPRARDRARRHRCSTRPSRRP